LIYSKFNKEIQEDQKIKNNLFRSYSYLFNKVKKIIVFEDYKYSIKELVILYVIMKVINLINDKFLLLIIMNIIIFYAPIDNICDHFLFKIKMGFVQIFEGIIGLLECLIPRYEEPKIKK